MCPSDEPFMMILTLESLAPSLSVLLRDNVPSAEPAAVRAAGGDDLRVSGMDRGDQGRKVSERERES